MKAVFTDESVIDSHNEKIVVAGIDLKRFKKNPVLLYQHYNSTMTPIGRVKDIRVEGLRLVGEIEFYEDDYSASIKKLYETGYMRGFSIGFKTLKEVEQEGGVNVVEKSVLYEISCVALPSNENALLVSLKGIEGLKKREFFTEYKIEKKKYMKDLILKEFGFETEEEALGGLKKMRTDLESAKLEIKEKSLQVVQKNAQIDTLEKQLLKEQGASKKEKAIALVQKAVSDTKITKAQESFWMEQAEADYEKAKSYLDAVDSYTPITARLKDTGAGEAKFQNLVLERKSADWTLTKWHKEDPKGLARLRDEYPDDYNDVVGKFKKASL